MFVNGDYFVWLAQELHRLPSIIQAYGAQVASRLEYAGILRALRLLLRSHKKSNEKSKNLLALSIGVRTKRK